MAYIIGHKSISLKNETVAERCENCGEQMSVTIHVFQKYVHFFWIPFLPAGKTGISECANCKQTLTEKQMPASLLATYQNLKSAAKIPIWMFSGAALFVVLFIALKINEQNKSRENAKLILAPKVGDVLEVKNKDKQYTLCKIVDLRGDSVLLISNKYQSSDPAGLSALKDSAYSEEISYIAKPELKKLFDKGDVIDIHRE